MRLIFHWSILPRLLYLQIAIGTVWTVDRINGISYFETITHVVRQSRIKKSLKKGLERMEYASFQAFNRSFDIILKSGTDVLTKDFVARVIQTNGRTNRFHVNVNDHFTGHLLNDPTVDVDGHMEDTMISLTIFDHQDMYALEPARIYRRDTKANSDRTWIVYRYSDTQMRGRGMGMDLSRMGNESYCASDPKMFPITNVTKRSVIVKRNGGLGGHVKDACVLMVVATYDLFKDRCKSSVFLCAQLLISNVVFADRIFSRSNFGSFPTGVHLQIKEMMIYEKPTPKTSSANNFNKDLKLWDYLDLLKAFNFAVSKVARKFCVVFLFNAHNVNANVLGLAYISATCSSINNGFATSRSDPSTIISTLRNRVLFVHGHIFGSHHDPEKPECYKPSNRGGNYIMWPYITEGDCANCKTFSPCSTRSIKRYLTSPFSTRCFQENTKRQSLCGNGVVDAGEQCDEGFRPAISHSCCNHSCQFAENAMCSDYNKGCCKMCQRAPRGLLCRGHVEGSCVKDSFCDGESLDCPSSASYPEYTPCKDNGRCLEGQCRSYCFSRGWRVQRNLKSCMCSQNAVDGCKLCCYDATDANNPGQCLPRGQNLSLADGRSCYIGTCKSGKCVLSASKTFQIIDLISGFDLTRGATFMRNNIVSTVIVLSLMIWIPACWAISEIDRQLLMMQEEEEFLERGTVASPKKRATSLFIKSNSVHQISPSNLVMTIDEPFRSHPESRESHV